MSVDPVDPMADKPRTKGLISSGTLATFGKQLEQYFGASALNPGNMSNNCVSVCVAKLMSYRNVYELWAETYGRPLPDQPLDQTKIIDLISRAGWTCHWEHYALTPGKSVADSIRLDDMLGIHHGISRALLYSRPDGTGHCVIWDPKYSSLAPMCFQHDDDGVDVTHDIVTHTGSVTIVRMRCPPETSAHRQWLERRSLRKRERRESQRNWSMECKAYMDIHKDERERTWGNFDNFIKCLRSMGIVFDEGASPEVTHDEVPSSSRPLPQPKRKRQGKM